MKQITKEAVKQAMIALLDNEGTATAYDVKMALRIGGFWALQKEVSALCRSFYQENSDVLERKFTGTHFQYSYAAVAPPEPETSEDPEDSDEDPDCEECDCRTCVELCKACDDCRYSDTPSEAPPTKPESQSVPGWDVFHAGSVHRYIVGGTRNQARYVYSRYYGVPYSRVHARKALVNLVD